MRLKKKTKKVFVDHHITRTDSVFSLPFIDFVCSPRNRRARAKAYDDVSFEEVFVLCNFVIITSTPQILRKPPVIGSRVIVKPNIRD